MRPGSGACWQVAGQLPGLLCGLSDHENKTSRGVWAEPVEGKDSLLVSSTLESQTQSHVLLEVRLEVTSN